MQIEKPDVINAYLRCSCAYMQMCKLFFDVILSDSEETILLNIRVQILAVAQDDNG